MTVPGGLTAAVINAARSTEGTHTFDAKSTYTGAGVSNQLTHTCAANATLLVVCITISGNPRTGTAPEYNGVAMTEVSCSPKDLAETVSELWYVLDPPTGSAYTVDVDNPATSKTMAITAVSFISSTGVTEYDTCVGSLANPDTDPTSDSITTGKNGCVVVDASGSGDAVSMTGNKTLLYSVVLQGARYAGHQYELKATAGSTTFTWNTSIAEDGTHVLASFKPN
jgi:hypothetical protein